MLPKYVRNSVPKIHAVILPPDVIHLNGLHICFDDVMAGASVQ